MFLLPTRTAKDYRGKHPYRINGWAYSRNSAQDAIASFLRIKRPVHLELNDGTRYIADFSELHGDRLKLGAHIEDVIRHTPTVLVHLSQARYDSMLGYILLSRERLATG